MAWRYLEGMDSPEQDHDSFQQLLELERPLVEAIWRYVLYGETLDDILGHLTQPGSIDDTSLGRQTRDLIAGTYRHILRLEAEERAASAN